MVLRIRVYSLIFVVLCMVLSTSLSAAIIYVDDDATGQHDGSTWEHAFVFLQEALAIAQAGDEVRVAQGVYKPDQNYGSPEGTGARNTPFELINGVMIKGGYEGLEGGGFSRRDPEIYISYLDGDLGTAINFVDDAEPVVFAGEVDQSAVLDGFCIEHGMGMYLLNASPTIRNCQFVLNKLGGIYSEYSRLHFTNCVFVDAYGPGTYGGAISCWYGSLIVDRCLFKGNYETHGAAISLAYTDGEESHILNSEFYGNFGGLNGSNIFSHQCDTVMANCVMSGGHGRAITFQFCNFSIVNCTIAGQRNLGGATIVGAEENTEFKLHNSILWDNQTPIDQVQVYLDGPTLAASHSIVQGGTLAFSSSQELDLSQSILDVDPQLANAQGPDNLPGTLDDNLRVLPGSPAIDAGNNEALLIPGLQDVAGMPRFVDDHSVLDSGIGGAPIIDMGAYEGKEVLGRFEVSTNLIETEEDQEVLFTLALTETPVVPVYVELVHASGDPDIQIVDPENGRLLFDETNFDQAQQITIRTQTDEDLIDDLANIQIQAEGYISAGLTILVNDTTKPPSILYVDVDAPGSQDGSNWEHAHHELRVALDVARQNPEIAEIRVAEGVYYPQPLGNIRRSGFTPVPGVAIRGAYAGYGQTDPNVRDMNLFTTVLDGDISRNDVDLPNPQDLYWLAQTRKDNSYSIFSFVGDEFDRSSVVDGFTMRSGNGVNQGVGRSGGLKIINGASPVISNCIIERCTTDLGGAAFIDGNPLFINTVFRGNVANVGGGAVYREGGSPEFINCCFYGNKALEGGALCADASGRIAIKRKHIWTPPGLITLINCTIAYNKATDNTVGIKGYGSQFSVSNSILWGDETDPNELVSLYTIDKNDVNEPNISSEFMITDSVLLRGHQGIQADVWSQVTWGPGMDEFDPMFVNARGPDEIFGTGDDDFHLFADSPCIDRCRGGRLGIDLEGKLQQHKNGMAQPLMVDMGCFEFGPETVPAILYVDDSATGNGQGTSWDNAFTDLQVGLLTASASLGQVQEIHVAEGSYRPDDEDKDATFQLLTGVSLYGGYPNGGANFSERDPIQYQTVLTGDLLGNDGADWSGYEENSTHVVTGSNTDASAVLDGFIIRGGDAVESVGAGLYVEYGSPTIRNCQLTENQSSELGSAIGALHASLHLVDCLVQNNDGNDVSLENSEVWIQGVWDLASTYLYGKGLLFAGTGTVQLDAASVLDLHNTTVRCSISGPGTIQVASDSELMVEGQALIDLRDENDVYGQIDCQGLLHLREEAVLAHADVNIHRVTFEDAAVLVNCVVKAEAGAPYGQFFVEGQAGLMLERLWADGDRYLDLDPRYYDVNNIQVNAIDVEITEGIGGTQGGLFELRGFDLDLPGQCDDFLCQYTPVPGFGSTTWSINRLELKPGAKLNLTNRFDFQAPFDEGGADEVLYVKTLVLGADSVLNTSYNRVYYETLEMAPSAQVVNIPLLGFSLNNISFDDENDYLTRVIHNNVVADEPEQNRIHVERLVGQEMDPNGLLQLCALSDDNKSLPARAKALFAKASESEVLIRFEYLWQQALPGSELIIYLTDVPELLSKSDTLWQDHYLEVARLTIPPLGFAGATDSNRWGIFERQVARKHLEFIRGTRVEFELIGPAGTCLWINNWDPGIRCLDYCGDVAGPQGEVNVIDFLAALSECGRPICDVQPVTGTQSTCLDGFFCVDGIVSHDDALAIDYMTSHDCSERNLMIKTANIVSFSSIANSSIPTETPEGLYLLGKRYREETYDFQSEALFHMVDIQAEISTSQSLQQRHYTKLVHDMGGGVYALNLERGLVQLDGQSERQVVGPSVFERDGQTVYMGLHNDIPESLPILDAVFAEDGSLYIVPVLILTHNGDSYQGAAKLNIDYDLEMVYEVDVSGLDIVGLRELALDSQGHLFVTNVDLIRQLDSLWAFEMDTGRGLGHVPLTGQQQSPLIPAPRGLHIAKGSDCLCLASGLSESDAQTASLYTLSVTEILTYLAQEDETKSLITTEISLPSLGQITDITDHPETNKLCVLGFTMPEIPGDRDILFAFQSKPFYFPKLAEVSLWESPSVMVQTLNDYGSETFHDLALPLSAVWID